MRIRQLIFSLILIAGSALAGVHADTNRFEEGLLWKIEKEGIYVGHIFGTLHMNDERIVQLNEKVEEVLDHSKSFAMEAFPSDHYWNPYRGGKLIKNDMILPEGETLDQYLDKDTYRRVEEALVGIGMKPEFVNTLKPWAAMRSFAVRAKSDALILDYALLERAASQRKELYQVESIEEFIVSLQGIPIEAQVELLKFTVNSFEAMPTMIDDMLEAYLEQDLKEMYTISTRFIPQVPENEPWREVYQRHVVEHRNVVMEHYMRKPMREGDTFIAVGAIHLYGEKGVLALIEKDGYTVTRVNI